MITSKTTQGKEIPITEKDGEKVLMSSSKNKFIFLTLNRPSSMNALDLHSLGILVTGLKLLQSQSIVITGQGDKAFCSGGDILQIYRNLNNGPNYLDRYLDLRFELERVLEHQNMVVNKQIICIMNGICLGGGYVLAQHSNYRIVTEDTLLSFPESKNGLAIPSLIYLSTLEKRYIVNYLVLTGSSLKGSEIIDAGLADQLIPFKDLNNFQSALSHIQNPNALKELIIKYSKKNCYNNQPEKDNLMKKYFSETDDLRRLVELLQKGQTSLTGKEFERKFCENCLQKIQKASPMAIKVNYTLLKKAESISGEKIYSLNKAAMKNLFLFPDFQKAISLRYVQKQPESEIKWTQPNHNAVDQKEVERLLLDDSKQILN